MCLPNPAADTLEDTPAEAELEDAAEAAAEGADAQLGEPVEKITRTNVANGRKPCGFEPGATSATCSSIQKPNVTS